ncbi:MAG: hypothetical protein U5L96_05600 [Owenweeksia sp.]|nr:hypothetical protein [Owenweeksia sp.]
MTMPPDFANLVVEVSLGNQPGDVWNALPGSFYLSASGNNEFNDWKQPALKTFPPMLATLLNYASGLTVAPELVIAPTLLLIM